MAMLPLQATLHGDRAFVPILGGDASEGNRPAWRCRFAPACVGRSRCDSMTLKPWL